MTAIGSVRINVAPAATVVPPAGTAPPTVAPPTVVTPPTVLGLSQTRRRGALGNLLVRFSRAMAPAGVLSLGAYRLVSAGRDRRFGTRDDRTLALRSAVYDPASMTVALTPKGRTALNQPMQLVARGSSLVDLALNSLDGDGDGRPGGDFVGRFGTRPRA